MSYNTSIPFTSNPTVHIRMKISFMSFLLDHTPKEQHPFFIIENILKDRINSETFKQEGGLPDYNIDSDEDEWAETELYIGCMYHFGEGEYEPEDIDTPVIWSVNSESPSLSWYISPGEIPGFITNSGRYGAKVWVWDEKNSSKEEYEPIFRRFIVVGIHS